MLDFNRDGELSNADFANGVRAALPLGSIGDVADASGPDNWIGNDGYLWEQASGLYHVPVAQGDEVETYHVPRDSYEGICESDIRVSVRALRRFGMLHNVLPIVSTPIAERLGPYAVEP